MRICQAKQKTPDLTAHGATRHIPGWAHHASSRCCDLMLHGQPCPRGYGMDSACFAIPSHTSLFTFGLALPAGRGFAFATEIPMAAETRYSKARYEERRQRLLNDKKVVRVT